jgi:ABC-type phosphate/phosphonate transport system ATPase subunit
VLNVAGVGKQYPTPRGPLTVLSDVNFALAPGDAAAITGPSGSGKSSLLYMLGALEPPSQGTITLDGRNPFDLTAAALADFRNTSIGFVFQDHCLLPQCSVLEMTRNAHARASSRWDWVSGWTTGPVNYPAVRSSAPRSRAPWCGSLAWFCAMSRLATSIRRRPQPWRRCCSTCTRVKAIS